MRGWRVVLLALLAGPAAAQNGLTPLGPLQTPPPGVASSQPPQVQAVPPLAPIQSQSLQPDAFAHPAPTLVAPQPAGAPTPLPADWQPRGLVELRALDKVTARATMLTGKAGEMLHFGSLSIAVRSCVSRPPDQPADSAVYLDITDLHVGAAEFHGWMLAAEPSIGMLEHPVYDIRLAACR